MACWQNKNLPYGILIDFYFKNELKMKLNWMVLYHDMWNNKNSLHGIIIEIWPQYILNKYFVS
jgi:hypothetical protein